MYKSRNVAGREKWGRSEEVRRRRRGRRARSKRGSTGLGTKSGTEFFAGYVTEKSPNLDNIFVFFHDSCGPADSDSEPGEPVRRVIIRPMPHHSLGNHKSKIAVALILTISSGVVDTVGFLGIFGLFTAHVTGTTVHLGQSIVLGKPDEVIAAFVIMAVFFLGSVVGRAIVEAGARQRLRRIASIMLAIEAAMLVFVIAAKLSSGQLGGPTTSAQPGTYLYLALLSGAMGLQTATLTRLGPLTVHTTFVTGMVNKLAQLVSRILFRSYDFLRGRATTEKRTDQSVESKQAIFVFSIWVCYVLGGIVGTASYLKWGIRALFVAVLGLVLGIVTDAFAPLSIEEEREQSER